MPVASLASFLVSVAPGTYRNSSGKGRTQASVKICWAPTEKDATKTVYQRWGFEEIDGQIAQDLPMWHEFEP